ncbi:MAG: hypothetical protein WCO56_12175 [Verrucomicrobiota bacterium]
MNAWQTWLDGLFKAVRGRTGWSVGRHRTKRLVRRGWPLLILFGCLVAALFYVSRDIFRPAVKRFFAARFFRQASRYEQKKDYGRAAFSARKALSLNAQHEDSLRLMAQMSQAIESPVAMDWGYQLVATAPASSNQLLLARIAMRWEGPPYPTAGRILRTVDEQGRKTIEFHLAAAELALKNRQPLQAEAYYEAASRLEPDNLSLQINLASLRLLSTNHAATIQAEIFLKQYLEDSQYGTEVCRSLLAFTRGRKDFQSAKAYSRRILASSKAIKDRLDWLAILQESNDPDYARSLKEEQVRDQSNPELATALALWLVSHKHATQALAWLRSLPPGVQSAKVVRLAMADCFEALQDWTGLANYLRAEQWREQESLRWALLVRTLRQSGHSAEAQLEWNNLMAWASLRQPALAQVFRVTREWGWQPELELTAWALLERYPGEYTASAELQRVLLKREDTRGLLRLFNLLYQNNPTDTVAKNNFAYLCLLLNTNLPQAHQLAAEAYQAYPKDWRLAATYAFSLLSQGNAEAAVKVYDAIPVSQIKDPSLMAQYGIILAGAGRVKMAQYHLEKSGSATLLPEERKLFNQAAQQVFLAPKP